MYLFVLIIAGNIASNVKTTEQQTKFNDNLVMAIELFKDELYEEAVELFIYVINSNLLSIRGKAIVYWSIATSYSNLNDHKSAAQYYFYFSVIAQNIINNENGFIDRYGPEFDKSFDLNGRMRAADKYVDFVWRTR